MIEQQITLLFRDGVKAMNRSVYPRPDDGKPFAVLSLTSARGPKTCPAPFPSLYFWRPEDAEALAAELTKLADEFRLGLQLAKDFPNHKKGDDNGNPDKAA